MTEVVELASDWTLLLLAILIFGLAPGVVLRLVLKAYPTGHSRREELLAELYAMNWAARPFWVAQQLETAIFEGLPARRARAAVTKATDAAAVTEAEAVAAERKAASELLEALDSKIDRSKIGWSGRVAEVGTRRTGRARRALLDAYADETHPI